ncbi:hypothetical protein [Aneurinibacillus tyrosinisolvens]|uniref:hypothetical protein n=1 Tax=Aneurinibacillus tyrosinisolvens TaxID=1443435 RepID=UPI00063F6498|nr:hypothetical protein [Aneurinibacillus tyrosinisolvens]
MADVITINGKVKYGITLDPGVWIFDDRKFKMEDFVANIGKEAEEAEDTSIKSISEQWDKELKHGVTPTAKSEMLFVEKKKIAGDYGIALWPFITNAEPESEATTLVCRTGDGEEEIALEDAKDAVLCFAIDGKPIRENGPVFLYYGDGRNLDHPIRGIQSFFVR